MELGPSDIHIVDLLNNVLIICLLLMYLYNGLNCFPNVKLLNIFLELATFNSAIVQEAPDH